MVTDSDSVHEQVTHLCRNILKSESKSTSHHRNCDIIVRALRARSFEILLNKSKKPSIGYLQSDDDLDPVTKILGYSYCLYQWNLKVQAKKLHKLINDLSNCNNPAIDSVLLFLAHLADERPRSNKVECQEFRAVGTRTMPYLEFMPQIFEPPWSLDVPSEKSHPFNRDPGEGLTMRGFSPGNLKWCPHEEFDFIGLTKPRSLVIPKVLCLSDHQYRDEGYGSPSQDHSMTVSCSLEPGSSDIWELALNSRHAVTRTWESLGSLNPSREKPFLIEASTDCVQKVWKSKVGQKHLYMDPSNATNSLLTVLPRQKLIQDLKLMLVGVPSQTFQCHQKGDEFVISRRICVEGLSPGTLQAYCKDFLVAGSCCLRLKKMVSSSSLQEGLMLQALCGSLSSYLYLYRCAVMRLPDSQLLLQLRHQFDSLLIQITSLAFLCKVHPGLPGETLPEGVALLAYLYEEIQKVTRKDVARILYSALQACCQVYFRFLQKWLFEGMCHDTYTEFFIQEQSDLMTCRDREYWSKGHYLLTHAVPGFLHGLEQAIFKCGKAMNLLKICNPQDTLCVVLQSGYPDIECCLSSDRLHSIQYKWLSYQYRALAVSGMPLNLSRLLQRSQEEKFVFQWMIQSAQKEHLRVLKLERENEIAAAASAKDRQFIMMKQQITKQIEDKKERLKEDEIVSYESKKLQEEERKLINMEKAELETYYLFLTNEAEKRRLRANMKIEQMKNTSESVVNLTQLDMQLLRTGTLVVEPPLCSNDDQYVDSSTTFETASNRSDMDIIPMASTGSDKNIIPTAINRSDMGIIPIASNRSQLNIIPKTSNRTDIGIIPILGNESDMSIITAESTRSDMDIIPYASNRSDMNILPVTSNRSNMGVIPTASNKSDMGVIVMASNRSDAGIIPTASNRTNMDITRLERNRCDMGIVPTPSNKCDMEIIPTAGNISVMDIKPLCYQSQTTLGEVPLVNITNCVLDMGGRRSNCDAEDVVDTDLTAINIILQKSIILPLKIQASLVNNAVLKLFLEKEGLLSHLHSLRNYFFLLDGEFARNVTTGLFECMYDASTPADMLNSVTLNSILSKSLTRADPNADRLSFQVKYIPPHFSVSSPLCLDCVMLQYKVSWPLNIILTSTALNKYNEVFGFLLRLRRISWVLEEDFHHLKRGANESPEVLKSPQYHRLQLYRHEMTHFIHACQSYVTASVLQASWVEFLNNMQNAHTLDDLYRIHVTYVKLVLFRCLLNKQSAAIQKSLVDSLRLVLKFHGQLCSGVWQKKPGDDHYTHPKFSTLVHIYTTFHDLAAFIFKFATKIATTGYQPHLHALLQMLNMNGFYPQYF